MTSTRHRNTLAAAAAALALALPSAAALAHSRVPTVTDEGSGFGLARDVQAGELSERQYLASHGLAAATARHRLAAEPRAAHIGAPPAQRRMRASAHPPRTIVPANNQTIAIPPDPMTFVGVYFPPQPI